MRITPFIIFNQLTQSLDRSLQDYAKLNENLSSGKRILSPSDDAMGLMRAMDYKVRISGAIQYQQNIELVKNGLNVVNTVMNSYNNFLATATALIAQNEGGTQDATSRAVSAQQATALRDIFMDLGNTKINDQYVFAGFRSDTPAYAAGTFDYQGDSGAVQVPIDNGATLAANVTGDNLFSYTLTAATSVQISGGRNVHYTPGAGTTIDVEIRDAADTTVLDTFSFSNVIQMTDALGAAITANDTGRLEALAEPFRQVQAQMRAVQGEVGSRLSLLEMQSSSLTQSSNSLKTSLATIEQADMVEVVAKLKTTEVTLQAVRESASRVLSLSLFDFLK